MPLSARYRASIPAPSGLLWTQPRRAAHSPLNWRAWGAFNAAQLNAEAARAAAEAEARRRLDAEERARRDAEDCAVWQQLAEEAEQRLTEELETIQAHAAAQPPEALERLAAASYQAGEKLELDEAATRRLIDAQLRETGWEVDSDRLTHESGARPEAGRNRAIAEWPTSDGRADYVLFAATIIGFVRQQALGEPLVPYDERVQRALKKVLASRPWTPPQKKWLERIGHQLTANVVLDRQSFDSGAFKDHGGWAAMDKALEGKLEQVLGELTDHVWSPAA